MQLTAFVDAGGTLVDTADVYGDGESERILGHLLDRRRPPLRRARRHQGRGRTEPGPMGGGASRGHLLAALDASLERLGLDHVDLWQLHAWDDDVAAGGDAGRRATSRSPPGAPATSGCQQLHRLADRAGRHLAARLAGPHAGRQHPGRVLAAAARRRARGGARRRGATGWACCRGRRWAAACSPASTGTARPPTPAAPRRSGRASSTGRAPAHRPHRRGRDHRGRGLGTTPLAVALAWVRDRPGVVAPVVGARTAQQLQASLDAEEPVLPPAIRTALDDVSCPRRERRGRPRRLGQRPALGVIGHRPATDGACAPARRARTVVRAVSEVITW